MAGIVDCLIFSRDRAAQLDLLLRSIQQHARAVYRSLRVLYWATSADLWAGYQACVAEHPEVLWYKQTVFEMDVRDWLQGAGPIVSFLVDDDVFYRDAALPESLPWSYRGGDYDYPFSLDGNVYTRFHVKTLLDGITFSDPTRLEAGGHVRATALGWPRLKHGVPCLVGLPWNRVSPSSNMPHGDLDPAGLNNRYLAGERLAVPRGAIVPAGDTHIRMEPIWVS